MEEKDPLVSSWFALEFQGAISGAFTECSGLTFENAVVEYKASGANGQYVYKKVPGRPTYGNVTLKRGVTDSMELWDWRKLVDEGNINEARKDGSLVMFNQQGEEVARWNFVRAWPSKITGPGANAGNDDIAIEELELAHEGVAREK